MSKISANLGGNTGAVIAGGAMALVLVLGAYIGFGRSEDGGAPAGVLTSAPEPQSAPGSTDPDPAPAPVAEVAQEPAPQAPSFDEVRREQDGTTVIAGRAEPLSEVTILLDGAQVASAKADSSGGFAAIAVLPPKQSAQVVSLSAQTSQNVTVSQDEIILAPSARAEPAEQTPAVAQATLPPETPAQQATAEVQPEAAAEQVATAAQPEAAPQPSAIAVLKSDEQGVSLLASAAPQTMTAVALDTIGYSDIGDVQLTGRAQPDTAKVRIYLDNRSVISLPVDADGRWRGDLPDVDEGIYTLRVDEVSAQGTVSSRVETPFKRESAETLAQAAADAEGPVKSVTVQAGATLWAIARDRYGDGTLYVRVFEANADSIRNPDLIYPGQVFDLPN